MKVLKIIGLLLFGLFLVVFIYDPKYALATLFEPYISGIFIVIFLTIMVIINRKFSSPLSIFLTIFVFIMLFYAFFIY